MNLRDEIAAMALTDTQAVIHLADEIDSLRQEMSSQHSAVHGEIELVRAELRAFIKQTEGWVRESQAASTRLVYLVSGAILAAAGNIFVLLLNG